MLRKKETNLHVDEPNKNERNWISYADVLGAAISKLLTWSMMNHTQAQEFRQMNVSKVPNQHNPVDLQTLNFNVFFRTNFNRGVRWSFCCRRTRRSWYLPRRSHAQCNGNHASAATQRKKAERRPTHCPANQTDQNYTSKPYDESPAPALGALPSCGFNAQISTETIYYQYQQQQKIVSSTRFSCVFKRSNFNETSFRIKIVRHVDSTWTEAAQVGQTAKRKY